MAEEVGADGASDEALDVLEDGRVTLLGGGAGLDEQHELGQTRVQLRVEAGGVEGVRGGGGEGDGGRGGSGYG